MGVPSYYKTIINDFPSTLSTTTTNNDRVFLDFNCAIHQISNTLKSSTTIDVNNTIVFEDKLIEETLVYIDKIVSFANPKELLYISIDGVPSRSKIIQQRQRRFNGMTRKNKMIEILSKTNEDPKLLNKIKYEWNSDNISPGTIFMKKLSVGIQNHLKSMNVKTILSDDSECGEGEFKIMKYIRENTEKDGIIDIVYGLDADLIMLSLINNKSKIYLLREPQFFDTIDKSNFIYFDIELLSKKIIETMTFQYNIEGNNSDLIHVYVFLCIFLGNDFIPAISYIRIKNDGITILLSKYSILFSKYKSHIVYKEENIWKIDNNLLFKYVKLLADDEDKQFALFDNLYYTYKPRFNADSKDKYKNLENIISINTTKFVDVIKPNHPKWRQRYYYYLFDDKSGNTIPNVCKNYFEAFNWITDYYFNQTYHKTWFYRFIYSPTLIDLANYLQSICSHNGKNILVYDKKLYPNIEISTDLQLLMILPINSINLIQDKFKEIITDIQNGFVHYYPYNTSYFKYLRIFNWEFIPKLPEFDIIELYEAIEKINRS